MRKLTLAFANSGGARTENQESYPREKQDVVLQKYVAMGRLLGAKSAREAAEMAVGRPMTEKEWMQFQEPWDRNWKS